MYSGLKYHLLAGQKPTPEELYPLLMMAEYCEEYERKMNKKLLRWWGGGIGYCDALIYEGAVLLYPNNYKVKVYKDLG